jgi:LmbE family N-acetylglucosaminyl deacetylase
VTSRGAYDLCMKTVALMLGAVTMLLGQESQIRVIAFGAHPDDCDIRAAGSAALWKKMGAAVKFVSITNGDVGHQTMHGEELARSEKQKNPRTASGSSTTC